MIYEYKKNIFTPSKNTDSIKNGYLDYSMTIIHSCVIAIYRWIQTLQNNNKKLLLKFPHENSTCNPIIGKDR